MIFLVVVAVLVIAAFGVAFTIHWLFVVAAVLALAWLIGFLLGSGHGRSRGVWW